MLSDARPNVGMNIRRARLAAHLTQQQLAQKMDIGQAQMSRLELSPNPRDSTIRRAAAALEVQFEQLKPSRAKRNQQNDNCRRWLPVLMPMDAKLRTRGYLATTTALRTIADAGQKPRELLERNAIGDWGELPQSQRAANDRALITGDSITAKYHTKLDAIIVIVTDAADEFGDRSRTTIMLPEEAANTKESTDGN